MPAREVPFFFSSGWKACAHVLDEVVQCGVQQSVEVSLRHCQMLGLDQAGRRRRGLNWNEEGATN
jgi:hypothetical protein